MAAVSDWITQIIILILLAMVLELLLPNDSFQSYVKMVIGLVLIVALLSPIMRLMNTPVNDIIKQFTPPEQSNNMKKSTSLIKKGIESDNHKYIHNIMAVQMKSYVEKELIDKYDLAIKTIDPTINFDKSGQHVTHVSAVLVQANSNSVGQGDQSNGKNVNGGGSSNKKAFDPIVPVQNVQVSVSIDDDKVSDHSSDDAAPADVIKFLAKQWSLSADHLTVHMEGGSR